MGHGEGYLPGVPSVTELLEADGYYKYPYQAKTEHTISGYWGRFDEASGKFIQGPDDAKAYFYKRGHWVNNCCDLLGQDNLRGLFNYEDTLAAIAVNQPGWLTKDWPGFITAYLKWLDRYPRRKLIGTQIYVCHKALGYQGTLDQLWVLEPGEPETVVDLKCVSEGAHCLPSTALQLAAYDDALGDPDKMLTFLKGTPTKRKRLGLALHADGTFIEDWYTNWRDYAAWRNLVQHYYLHGPKGKGEYR